MAPLIITVEMMSCHFTVVSTLVKVTLVKLVATNDVKNDTTIPTAVSMSGKYVAFTV